MRNEPGTGGKSDPKSSTVVVRALTSGSVRAALWIVRVLGGSSRARYLAVFVAIPAWAADCNLPDDWYGVLSDETRHNPFVLSPAYQNPPRERRRFVMQFVGNYRDLLIVVPREEITDDEDALRAAHDIAVQWSRLPRLIHELYPVGGRIELDREAHGGLSYANGGRIHIGYDGSPWPLEGGYDTHQPWTDEVLLHEAAHALDADVGWFIADEWKKAATKDGDFVTDYARTSTAEDFAESFVGWSLFRGYPRRLSLECRRHIRATMNERIKYFDRRLWEYSLTYKTRE